MTGSKLTWTLCQLSRSFHGADPAHLTEKNIAPFFFLTYVVRSTTTVPIRCTCRRTRSTIPIFSFSRAWLDDRRLPRYSDLPATLRNHGTVRPSATRPICPMTAGPRSRRRWRVGSVPSSNRSGDTSSLGRENACHRGKYRDATNEHTFSAVRIEYATSGHPCNW